MWLRGENTTQGGRGIFKGKTKQGEMEQMYEKSNHGFPESVKGFEKDGILQFIVGGDGKQVYHHLKISGSYNGYDGFFHFIKDPSTNTINHRIFQIFK